MSKTDQNWLGSILRDMRPIGVSYGHCTLCPPWAVTIDDPGTARLHVVIRGATLLRAGISDWVRLEEGDVAFLPTGAAHTIADDPATKPRPLSDFPQEPIGERAYRMTLGAGVEDTLLTCCAIAFAEPLVHPVLSAMPPLILAQGQMRNSPSWASLLDLMRQELTVERTGATTILAKLADVMVTWLIRDWVDSGPAETQSWVAAARDPKLGRALATIDGAPERAWSVEDLAREAGMSRSGLHAAFAQRLGTSPGRYLSRWRMVVAAQGLREGRLSVGTVARAMGFGSTEAFSRAFRRHIGISPKVIARRESVGSADPLGRNGEEERPREGASERQDR